MTMTETAAYNGHTDTELHAAFDKVKNADNWKDEIDAVIDEAEWGIVNDAVIYFTGGMLDIVERLDGGRVRVWSAGYYVHIGA